MSKYLPVIEAVTSDSGTYGYTTDSGGEWDYGYEIVARGSRSECRRGKLTSTFVDLTKSEHGTTVRTPWGMMQWMADTSYESGWLLEHTHGTPLQADSCATIEVPPDALDGNATWTGRVGEWGYRVYAHAMGSKGENRVGWLSLGRMPILGKDVGEVTRTPLGLLRWYGATGTAIPPHYEQGWLLRGTYDQSFTERSRLDRESQSLVTESPYLQHARFASDDWSFHGVALSVNWPLPNSEVRGRLSLDPNTCTINEFGDLEACTEMGIRTVDVLLSRIRLADPKHLGRRIYSVSGEGLPEKRFLVIWPDMVRMQLVLGDLVVPLFPRQT